MVKCEIVTIGDEILIGQIVDTNSAWLSSNLNDIGVKVERILSIQDSRDEIYNTLEECNQRADIVIVTGGLGPTKDDITKSVVCDFFNTSLVENIEVLHQISERLGRRGISVKGINRLQSHLPKGCTVLFNSVGTAPGMWLEKSGTIFVFMPGVPYEMKHISETHLFPALSERFGLTSNFHLTLLTQGIAESTLSELIEEWEESLPDYINLAYLPNPGSVKLRVSVYIEVDSAVKATLDCKIEELKSMITQYHYGYNDDTLSSVLGELLSSREETLSIAESCTGGAIAKEITSVSGCSSYYEGSVITYSNRIKSELLGVKKETLESFGAVSEDVVKEMALGVKKLYGSTYSIATSGVAGPTGGSVEKPVGTIWVAVAGPDRVVTRKFQYGTDRARNVARTTASVLNLLRLIVLDID